MRRKTSTYIDRGGMRRKMEEKMNCMDKKVREETKEILKKYPPEKDRLIGILNDVQEKYGYIPKQAQLTISEHLNIPMAEIYGVITFYSRFTLQPKGKYNISICLGTACFVKGSQSLLDRAKERLGMQKLDNSQKVYVNLDKKDYVQSATEEVVIEEEKTLWDRIIETLT